MTASHKYKCGEDKNPGAEGRTVFRDHISEGKEGR